MMIIAYALIFFILMHCNAPVLMFMLWSVGFILELVEEWR